MRLDLRLRHLLWPVGAYPGYISEVSISGIRFAVVPVVNHTDYRVPWPVGPTCVVCPAAVSLQGP